MKRYILILCVFFAAGTFTSNAAKADFNQLWDRANTSYVNGDYASSIVLYDSIVNQGYVSGKLYYNLANAYFKDNNIGKAILYYNKALKLSPSDKDTEYNLAVANTYTKDKIERVPEFFMKSWLRGLRSSLNTNAWAYLSIALFAMALGCALVYIYGEKKAWRKAGFFTAILLAFFFVLSVSFSVAKRGESVNASEAIVMSQAVAVKSSPSKGGNDLFIIHEGIKVRIVSRFDDWVEIIIADGNKGWIPGYSIELID